MAPKRRIVALIGPAGCGKTTAALGLLNDFTTYPGEEPPYAWHRHRFAGPIKEMLHCLGLSKEQTDGALKEVPCAILGGKTPRWAMQSLGTEWGRDLICDDLWLNAWKATMPHGNVVVDDCRFPNEASAIANMGGVIIRIDRPRHAYPKTHKSESHVIAPNATITNSGSVDDLSQALAHTIRGLF